MSMFDVRRVSTQIGGNEISFETGKLARQAGGAVVVRAGETMVLCTATMGNLRDVDFPPADGRRRGEALRGRQDPRLVLPPRGARRREGDADGADDRPSAAAAVPEGLALRDPAGRPADVGRPRAPLRHPGDERRLGGPRDLPDPRRQVRRRGADRQARRRLRRQPRGGDARRARDGPDRLRLGRGDPDGRVRRRRRHRGRGARCARHRPRRDQDPYRGDGGAARDRRQGEGRGRRAHDRRGLLEQISSKYGSRLDEATQIPEKLARQDAIDEVEREALAELAAGEGDVEVDPEKAPEVTRAFAKLEKDIIRRRIADRQEAP